MFNHTANASWPDLLSTIAYDKGKPVARQGRKAVSLPLEDSLVAESDRVSRPQTRSGTPCHSSS